MTASEMARELGISEAYLHNHWRRIVDNRAKIGIEVYKRGRGKNATYGIMDYDDYDVRWTAREEYKDANYNEKE